MVTDPAQPAVSTAVLFVCLGNICRSPLAQAALCHEARLSGINVSADSAGTGNWHAGNAPDPRSIAVARRAGIDISNQRARQIEPSDFERFDHIVALDTNNLADIEAIRPDRAHAHLSLLLDHVAGRKGGSVADPYYGTIADFEQTWNDVCEGARGLLRTIDEEGQIVHGR